MADSRAQMYPIETMYQIGVGNEEECHFDFSFIPFSQYTKFFNTLPNFIYKKCKNIKFSCDFEYEYSQKKKLTGKSNRKRENLISDSIAGSRPKFLPYLMKILSRVLPESKNLMTLQLSNLNIDPDNFDSVIDAVGQCRTLRNLEFTNIPFTDKHCIKLLKLISPYQYEELCFNDCLITSGSYRAFEEFLFRPPTNSIQERTIRKIELAGCTMSEVELDNIDYLLYGQGEEEEEEEEEVDQTVPTTVANTEDQNYDDYYEEEEDSNLNEPTEKIDAAKEDSYEYEAEEEPEQQRQHDVDEYEEDYDDEEEEPPINQKQNQTQKSKPTEAPPIAAAANDGYEYEYEEEEERPKPENDAEYEYEEEEDLPQKKAKSKQTVDNADEEEEYEYEDVQNGLPEEMRRMPEQKDADDGEEEYEYEYEDDPIPPSKPAPKQPPEDDEYEYEYTDEM